MSIDTIIQKPINDLNCDNNINILFSSNNIVSIKDIWILKRNDLKQMGFDSQQINQIIIKLQLFGLDLNKKKYHL